MSINIFMVHATKFVSFPSEEYNRKRCIMKTTALFSCIGRGKGWKRKSPSRLISKCISVLDISAKFC